MNVINNQGKLTLIFTYKNDEFDQMKQHDSEKCQRIEVLDGRSMVED